MLLGFSDFSYHDDSSDDDGAVADVQRLRSCGVAVHSSFLLAVVDHLSRLLAASCMQVAGIARHATESGSDDEAGVIDVRDAACSAADRPDLVPYTTLAPPTDFLVVKVLGCASCRVKQTP